MTRISSQFSHQNTASIDQQQVSYFPVKDRSDYSKIGEIRIYIPNFEEEKITPRREVKPMKQEEGFDDSSFESES